MPAAAKVPKTWTCQKQAGGIKCRHKNPKRKQICEACGKKRPAFKKKDHEVALELSYDQFIVFNGGEHCGICGKLRAEDRRLDRDHAHVGVLKGLPRGLLCHSCNRVLSRRMEISAADIGLVAWLRLAADYVERAEKLKNLNPRALI